jgi:multidrug efflux pump subunit AcrA (membrane-fusion protein)
MPGTISATVSFLKAHWFAVLLGVAVLGGGAYYYFFRQQPVDTSATIQTAEVKRGDLSVSVTGTGQVTSREQVNLRPVVAGDSIEVKQVAVDNDQAVKKDDLIAVLDTTDAMKEIRDAQNNLKSAEIKMDQTKRQFEDDTKGDKLNRDAQRVAVRQGEARVADARDDLQDYYIRAPSRARRCWLPSSPKKCSRRWSSMRWTRPTYRTANPPGSRSTLSAARR